jgi:hypothetical protein
MPAPPPLSEPAIVSATGSWGRFDMSRLYRRGVKRET